MWTCGIIACMYIVPNCNIVITQWHIYNKSKLVATYNYNATFEKVKHG